MYDWNQLYPRITTAIRQKDAVTPILVGGMGYSAVEWLPYLEPTGDEHAVYVVYQYQPFVYTHQETPLTNTYPGVFDTDWDGDDDQFNRAWLDNMLSTVDMFATTHSVPVAVNEFGVMRWEPGAAHFMNDEMELFEQRGMNHALWAWETSWEPYAEGVDAFNFRHGPDPSNHADVESSDLMNVIVAHWGRNTIGPSPPTENHTWTLYAAGFFPKHLPDAYTGQVVLADLDLANIPDEIQGVWWSDSPAQVYRFWVPGVGGDLTTLTGRFYNYQVLVTGACEWEIPLP